MKTLYLTKSKWTWTQNFGIIAIQGWTTVTWWSSLTCIDDRYYWKENNFMRKLQTYYDLFYKWNDTNDTNDINPLFINFIFSMLDFWIPIYACYSKKVIDTKQMIEIYPLIKWCITLSVLI